MTWPPSPRTTCLMVVGMVGGGAAVCVSMLLAALMTWLPLPGFRSVWVFYGADLVLSGVSAWPLCTLLERVGAEWDRQEARR